MSQIGQKLRELCHIEKNDAFSNFLRFGPKVDIFQFSEKLLEFFVLIEDSNVEKLEKNDGEKIFDLLLTAFC